MTSKARSQPDPQTAPKAAPKAVSGPIGLQFLGAVGTVTGSRFLVETPETSVLVDCGLFQGLKELRLRNWAPFPVAPREIDAVVLTHAHLDHTGYLPALVREGFEGPVVCTAPTAELAKILLRDSAHLLEEDAEYANRKGFSKHRPARPLYTQEDVERATRMLRPLDLGKAHELGSGLQLELRNAGHILGAASAWLRTDRASALFSGDLGRPDPPLLQAPADVPEGCSAIVVESTYGGRAHTPREQALSELASAIRGAFARGGSVLIPAFAVDRTPALLFALRGLMQAGELPRVPVFVDSPMALAGLELYRDYPDYMDAEVARVIRAGGDPFDPGELHVAPHRDDSRAINRIEGPSIIVSASGMATGGRILHHLKRRLPDSRNLVLIVGFQAAGTRGRQLADGARSVKIHGRYVPVRAEVQVIDGFSVHADQDEILRWLATPSTPAGIHYVVHGEPEQSDALASAIEARFDSLAVCPRYLERVLVADD